MIPKTASQIVFSGMVKKNLDVTEDGRCRLCGGVLLGNAVQAKKFYSDGWTDEAFIRDRNSNYICEPCNFLKKYYNQNLHRGLIATEHSFKMFETAQDILETLKKLPEDPFVLIFKTWGGTYRRHVIYFSPVNYNREQVSALFIFHPWHSHAGDNSMTACTMGFRAEKVLKLVEEYEKKDDVYQVNPMHHGPEEHLAAFIIGTRKRENKKK